MISLMHRTHGNTGAKTVTLVNQQNPAPLASPDTINISIDRLWTA